MYKWDVYGKKYSIIELSRDEVLVGKVCVDDGEQYQGELVLLDKNELYNEPPISYVDQQIAEKQIELNQLEEKVNSLKEEERTLLSSINKRVRRLQEHWTQKNKQYHETVGFKQPKHITFFTTINTEDMKIY